ncbi:4-(cytidine 5'-diphospho)-2-C-methyl-D-erythritol kinase [Oceanibium sediminis]|uniref:4-(cytidine 5'-diphospho)-2-C-methyl-D-erythritol kinase n=1 Tax=Oceanibium sediminis TaxID=2026339 RepID=UPI001E2A3AF9|nr:4-(cytidine 5'-diphospho)-2-C-methyl-D-erythritol kinase [Oceanibium sediminis]
MTDAPAPFLARAKINLCLHVTGQRPDGYHLLDSLVAFAELGDLVTAEPAPHRSLSLSGPFSAGLSGDDGNLVLKAAALYPAHPVALHLQKNLPLASGIGGGSADAAAALRAISALHDLPLPPAEQVLRLGADVPVCLSGTPVRMQGVGEVLTPLPPLPPLWCVLVNPGVGVPTGAVFAGLASKSNAPVGDLPDIGEVDALIAFLETTRNDLAPPAEVRVPAIAQVRVALEASEGCRLARMSGSGATVFGLFGAEDKALSAAARVRAAHPAWWVAAAPVGR